MKTKSVDLSSLKIDRSDNNNRRPGPDKKIIIGLIVAAVIILFFITKGFLNQPQEVKAATAVLQSSGKSAAVLNASGYVVAQRKASVASKGMGRLVFLGVVEGDQVKKNQIVARLEDNDIKAQLDEARANLNLNLADLNETQNDYNRQKTLYENGSTSKQSLDAAEARYNRVLALIEIARARVNAAEVNLENTLIRAPFDGTVLSKNAEVGEIVAPLGASATSRAAVLTMADMSSLQVEADVSESNIDKIKLNQDCEITLDAYPDKSYPGYIFKIVPTADRSKATVMVKVAFKSYDDRVLPEMSAKVGFLTEPMKEDDENTQALIIPAGAVFSREGSEYVFMIDDETAIERKVVTGRKFNKYIEIVSGLKPGDQVIESVNEEIKNGSSIKVKTEE